MNKGVVFWTTLYLKLAYNFAGVHITVAECQKLIQQGVALTWLARRAVSAAHAPGRRRADRPRFLPAAGRPARRQRYRRQMSMTDDSQQSNTGPLGGPLTMQFT